VSLTARFNSAKATSNRQASPCNDRPGTVNSGPCETRRLQLTAVSALAALPALLTRWVPNGNAGQLVQIELPFGCWLALPHTEIDELPSGWIKSSNTKQCAPSTPAASPFLKEFANPRRAGNPDDLPQDKARYRRNLAFN
jgi:hypothetical protein